MGEVEPAGGGGSGVKLGGNSHSFGASLFAKFESKWGKRHRGAALVALSRLFQSRYQTKKNIYVPAASYETDK